MKKIYLIATIVAIITGLAVFLFATELQNEKNRAGQESMIEVVVAATDIPQNTTITADMLTTVFFPDNTIPKTVITNTASLVGKIARYPVSKGEQFLSGKVMVIGDEKNDELAERIKEGYRAFTLSVSNDNGISGYLRVGDKIDIIVTKQIDEVSTTTYCLQDITIIAVGNATIAKGILTPPIDYGNITLEIPAVDCLILQHDLLNGIIRVVLRGFGDDEVITTPVIQ
ncbi:MAG: Flp pilus assembly protein CpaB [Firmicutes bacterium HGW-Firmicutes-21]|nr:MAG: Flp pilus assembly protein CpaB [Firmicutes bacterium HGW-Firmicutes-21]